MNGMRDEIRRPIYLVTILLLLVGIALVIGTPTPTQAEELKVGLLTTLSGPGTFWGVNFLRGAEYAVEDINKGGGIVVRGTKYTIKLIVEDDKYTPEHAVRAANKFIFTDKVKFIVGPMGSAGVLATAPIFEEHKIFQISDGFSPEITAPGKNLYTVNVIGHLPENMSGAMVAKFKELYYPSLKTTASIIIDNATGHGANKIAKPFLEAAGFKILDEVLYPQGTKEQRPVVSKALAKKPDAIWLMSTPTEDAAVQLKEIRLTGFKGPVWYTGTITAKQLVDVAGMEAADDFACTSYDAVGAHVTPELAALGKRFIAKYGVGDWDAPVPIYYNGLFMLKQTMETTGSLDPTTIRDQFLKKDIKWATLFGPAYMMDRLIRYPILFSIIKKGKPVNYMAYPPGYPKEK